MKLLLSKLRVWMEENSLPAPKLPVPWSTDKGYRRVPLLGPLSSKKGYPSDLLSRLDFSNLSDLVAVLKQAFESLQGSLTQSRVPMVPREAREGASDLMS